MPTGSTRCSTGTTSWAAPRRRARPLTFSATKPVYLKAASRPMFVTTETARTVFMPRVRGTWGPITGGRPSAPSASSRRPSVARPGAGRLPGLEHAPGLGVERIDGEGAAQERDGLRRVSAARFDDGKQIEPPHVVVVAREERLGHSRGGVEIARAEAA